MPTATAPAQARHEPPPSAAPGGLPFLDRLFTPHGASAYLRWVPVLGRGRTPAPGDARGVPTLREAGPGAGGGPSSRSRAGGRPATETGVVVRFARAGLSAPTAGSLLETAEAAGLTPANRCRRGICGTCTTDLVAGTVRDRRTGEITAEPGAIRICVHEACDAVTLDL